MTTITTRSNKSALTIAAERGLAEGTFTITKVATAKYELTFEEKTSDDMTLSQIADKIGEGGEQVDHDSSVAKPAKPARTTRIDRHWNDDGSLTIYVKGAKFRRIGGEDNEDASEDEIEDPEAAGERILNRNFPRSRGGWVYGRTTQGHNWHTKRAKMLRARLAELEAAGEDTTEVAAELARISSK